MVVLDGQVPSTGLGAEMDVMDETDPSEFVEYAVRGGGVDGPGGPFDGASQDLLHSKKPFSATGEHRTNSASRERESKPGPPDSRVEESFDLR